MDAFYLSFCVHVLWAQNQENETRPFKIYLQGTSRNLFQNWIGLISQPVQDISTNFSQAWVESITPAVSVIPTKAIQAFTVIVINGWINLIWVNYYFLREFLERSTICYQLWNKLCFFFIICLHRIRKTKQNYFYIYLWLCILRLSHSFYDSLNNYLMFHYIV